MVQGVASDLNDKHLDGNCLYCCLFVKLRVLVDILGIVISSI